MVLNIIEYTGDKLLEKNDWLETFAANCIKIKGDKVDYVVNIIGEEKNNFGPSDFIGIGAYARLEPNITYTEITGDNRQQSCGRTYQGSKKFRIVVFQIGREPKLHPYKTENKIWADLQNIDFSGYGGNEGKIQIVVNSSNLDFLDNFVQEIKSKYDIPADSIIIALNCTLTWIAAGDNCEEGSCDVYQEPQKCK